MQPNLFLWYIRIAFCIAIAPFLVNGGQAFAEVNTAFTVKVIVPGMTESIDVGQLSAFPFGCPTFLIFPAGAGMLGISLKKDDTAGDIIFMLGIVSSSEGSVPVFRIGQTKNMLDQVAEVGTGGFAIIYCGVLYSPGVPKYSYQFRISLVP